MFRFNENCSWSFFILRIMIFGWYLCSLVWTLNLTSQALTFDFDYSSQLLFDKCKRKSKLVISVYAHSGCNYNAQLINQWAVSLIFSILLWQNYAPGWGPGPAESKNLHLNKIRPDSDHRAGEGVRVLTIQYLYQWEYFVRNWWKIHGAFRISNANLCSWLD